MRRRVLAALCVPALLALPAGAQQGQFARPGLAKGVDPNDWESYYDLGVSLLRRSPSKADAAFYWATRLDPSRAEPIYGRWIAFWMNDISEWPDYLKGSNRVLEDPKIVAADTIRLRAWERNPLVNQALVVLLYEQLPGSWGSDPTTQGWLSYANGFYDNALKYFGAAASGDGDKRPWLHYDLALVYSQMGRYDSAASQMSQLLEWMRNSDRRKLIYFYESKEMFEYALGLLYSARGKRNDARASFETALQENLAFAPAHAAIGDIAVTRGDTATAVTEYGLAVELAAKDPVMHVRYARALLRAHRPADAIAEARLAVSLESFYADTYLALGESCDAAKDTAQALTAYGEYLKRAPQTAAERTAGVKERVAALTGSR